MPTGFFRWRIWEGLPSLKLTAKAPENRQNSPKSFNHPFAGENLLLVSGRYYRKMKKSIFLSASGLASLKLSTLTMDGFCIQAFPIGGILAYFQGALAVSFREGKRTVSRFSSRNLLGCFFQQPSSDALSWATLCMPNFNIFNIFHCFLPCCFFSKEHMMLLLHIYYKLINLLSHVLYTIPIFHFGNNMKLSALGFPRRGSQKNKRPQFFFEVKIAGKVYDRQGSWGALAVHPSPLPFFFWFWQPPKRRPTERLGAKSWKNKKSTRKLRSYCRLYIYIFMAEPPPPPKKEKGEFFFLI